jgi:hypothetical protein
MNSRRFMCCPQSEDCTLSHWGGEMPRCATQQIWQSMSELGVRRDKAALSSGCKSHPAIRSSLTNEIPESAIA